MDRHSFLACYDYGTGGVWLLLEADSFEAAVAAWPELVVFAARPDWMSEDDEKEFRSHCERIGYKWDIDVPPTGWLSELRKKA